MARKLGGDIVIDLTFGSTTNWARDVLAGGSASIRLNGVPSKATDPRLLRREDKPSIVRAAFNPVLRLLFIALGVKQFMQLRVVNA
jgi:hypothetical protein